MPFRLTLTTEGTDRLGLHELFERHIAELWMPEYVTLEEAEAFALYHFTRKVQADIARLVVRGERVHPHNAAAVYPQTAQNRP